MAFTKPKTAAEIRAQRPDTPERAARRAALVESLEAEVALHEIRERRGISLNPPMRFGEGLDRRIWGVQGDRGPRSGPRSGR